MDCNSDSSSSSVPPNPLPNSVLMPPYPLPHDTQEDKEKLALQQFWHQQFSDIQSAEAKPRQLLPTRVKKIMKDKAKDDKMLIGSEAPLVLAKACEVFVQELTFRAWLRAESNKKKTLQPCDVAMAVKKDRTFDFLANVADCGHHHGDDLVDLVTKNLVKSGDQALFQSQAAEGFMENAMMNLGEMMGINQQFAQSHDMVLPSPDQQTQMMNFGDQMMQQFPYFPNPNEPGQMIMQPASDSYLPLDQSEMMLQPYSYNLNPQYDQSEITMQTYDPSYLPPLPSDQQLEMVQPAQFLLPDQYPEMMQPPAPYFPSDDQSQIQPLYLPPPDDQFGMTVQPPYLPPDQSQTMQPPANPPSDPFSYDFYPK